MNGQGKARFQLPAAEDDLWHQVVVRLLEQRDSDEEQAENHLRLLEELAFHYRFCEKPLTRAFVENTATWLAEEKKFGSPRDKAQVWLVDLERWELLLRRASGHDATYEFAIPMLDEYFAARHLAARWAEEDEKYRTWLPCSEGWWRRGKSLLCPNPHCRATLPSFRKLLRQPEYEETLLLTESLLKDGDREEVFLSGIRSDFNFMLKALSRCRHVHANVAQDFSNSLPALSRKKISQHYRDGLVDLGRARNLNNLDAILKGCVRALSDQDDKVRGTAAYALCNICNVQAVEPLIETLGDRGRYVIVAAAIGLTRIGDAAVEPLIVVLKDQDRDWIARYRAASILGDIGDARAVQPLMAVLVKDEDQKVRWAAAEALGRLSDAQAVEPLIMALKDAHDVHGMLRENAVRALGKIGDPRAITSLQMLLHDPFRRVRGAAQQALEELQRRTGSESRTDT